MVLFRFQAWPHGPNIIAASLCRLKSRTIVHLLVGTRSFVVGLR